MLESRTLSVIAAAVATSFVIASANAAIVVTPDHIVSSTFGVQGTLVAIDVPFNPNNTPGGPDWPEDADDGFTTVNNAARDYRVNDKLWEPDFTDPAQAGSWFTYPGPFPSVKWSFSASSGINIPDGSVIHGVYAVWFSRNRDGITYQYDEGGGPITYVDHQGSPSAGDLVLSWTDLFLTVRNANFQRIFAGPIVVGGGDGFELFGTDNIGNAAHIDAIVIDVTSPGIPEPASLALLGLGGLMIARRRG